MKSYVMKRLNTVDISIAPFIQICSNCIISDLKSKFYYKVFNYSSKSRANMKSVYMPETSSSQNLKVIEKLFITGN